MNSYKRIDHFRELLNKSSYINENPDNVIVQIKSKLLEEEINVNYTSVKNIKKMLKQLKLTKYYEYANIIMHKLCEEYTVEQTKLYELVECDKSECGICMDEYTSFAKLSCSHIFCQTCIDTIINNKSNHDNTIDQFSCPMCRKSHCTEIIKTYSFIEKNMSSYEEQKNILLSEEEQKVLISMFPKVQYAFNICKDKDRVSFLNYNFVIKKLCNIKGYNTDIPLVLSKSKLDYYENIWSKMIQYMEFD